MKKLTVLLLLISALQAFAQDKIILDAPRKTVFASEAILARVAGSPDEVIVSFQVPMTETVCAGYAERPVTITSGSQCGYHTVRRQQCSQVCVRRNPHNNQCVNMQNQCRMVASNYPNSCTVYQTYCTHNTTATSFKNDDVKIKFKNLPDLAGTEEDLIKVQAYQNHTDGINVKYNISILSSVVPLRVKDRGLFGEDKFVIVVD